MKKKILALLILSVVCIAAAFVVGCGEPEHTHTYGEWETTAATCTESGSRTRTCTGCNNVETETIDALGHEYSVEWTVGDNTHYHACIHTGCTDKSEEASHNTNGVLAAKAATCEEDGLTAGVSCSVCDKVMTAQETINAIEHDYATTEWTSDGTSHWHACQNSGCNSKNDSAAHTHTVESTDAKYIKSAATCTELAVYYKSCVCGVAGTETFTDGVELGHAYDEETWSYNDTHHYHVCTRCSENGESAEHSGSNSCTTCDRYKETAGLVFTGYNASGSQATEDIAYYAVTGIGTATAETDIYIPDTYNGKIVTHIAANAFRSKSAIESVTIGKNITTIGDGAFMFCTGLTKVNYNGNAASWSVISFGDYYSNPIHCAENLYIGNKLAEDVVIPNTVEKISERAFICCKTLKTLTIESSNIGCAAFERCSGLQSIIIGNCVTEIEPYAFNGCTSVTFNNTTGWSVATSADAAEWTPVTVSATDFAANAELFTATYRAYYWRYTAPTVGEE